MREIVRSIIVLTGLVGCGGEPTCIEVDVGPATYLAIKESGGDWRTVDLADGEASVCVDREYVMLLVCDVSMASNLSVVQFAGTPGEQIDLGFCSSGAPRTLSVGGTMVQPGEILVGGAVDSSFAPNWSFDVRVRPGLHDLIATELLGTDQPLVAIRRNLMIDEDTIEPPIDLEMEGIPTVEVPVTVGGFIAGESIDVVVILETERSQSTISSNSNPIANVLPPSSLSESDHQYVNASSSTDSLSRTVIIDANLLEPIELPPALDDVLFEQTSAGLAASWGQLPPIEFELAILASASRAADHQVFVIASKRWLEATGATSLVLDPTAPAFDPQWILPGSDAFSDVRLEGSAGNASFVTSKRHSPPK